MPTKTTPLYEVFPGTDYSGLAYRVVQHCPASLVDFLSYEALKRRYDRRDFFKGTGVSMHTSMTQSLRIAKAYGAGAAIALLDLRHPSIVWARTGGRDHITVWAPEDVLLSRVLECESHE